VTIRLRLLAAPALHVADQPPLRLAPKDALLLALLALDGAQPRDVLAPLLWPDAPPAGGRANLRQRIKVLQNSTHQQLLQLDGGQLALLATVQHDLQGLAQTLQADPQAATGALLGHLQLRDCPAASEWLVQARARVDAQRQQALQDHAQSLEDSRDLQAALPYAQRLVAEASMQEQAWRRLMRLHYLLGDRSAALAAYRRLQQTMQRDSGHAPDAQTQALAQLIEGALPLAAAAPVSAAASMASTALSVSNPARAANLAAPAAHTAATWTALLRPPRLLQREAEWAQLSRTWAQGGTSVVLGEAGIGKSRLLHDFADSVGLTLRLQARPGDAAVPYTLLARWVAALQPQAHALPAWARAELARLLPALGPAPSGPLLPLHLGQAMALLGAPQDAVLLDDLHFADTASLELLPAVLGPLRCKLLAARSNELPTVLQTWLTASAHTVCTLTLLPWHADSVRELLEQSGLPCHPADLPVWAALLWRHTGGHPLLLLETLRAVLLAQAAEPPQPEGAPGRAPTALPTPPQVLQLVQARLQLLSPLALGVAQVASLAADSFSAAMAGAVLQQDAPALAAAWLELQAAALMTPAGLMHDLASQAVALSLGAPLAQALHRGIAQHLADCRAPAARVAAHWQAAACPTEAAHWHEAAARQAADLSRREEQVRHWASAAVCWYQAGNLDKAFAAAVEEVQNLITLGSVSAALSRCAPLIAQSTTHWQRAQGHRLHALALADAVEFEPALEAASRAVAAARLCGDVQLLADVLVTRAWAAASLGQNELASRCLQELHGLRPDEQDLHRCASRHMMISLALCILNRNSEALQNIEHAMALSQRPESASELLSMLGNSAAYLSRLGHLGRARQRAQEAVDLAARLGEDTTVTAVNAGMLSGMLAGAQGDFTDAIRHLENCLDRLEVLQLPRWRAITRSHLAWVWAMLGQADRALRLLNLPDTELTTSQVVRRWTLRQDLHRLCGTEAPAPLAQPMPTDVDGPTAAMARLAQARSLAPAACLLACRALGDELQAQELPGMALYTQVVALAAMTQMQAPNLPDVSLALLGELRDRIPNTAYWPEALWTVHQALLTCGETQAAQEALGMAWRWVARAHESRVPEAMRDSFLRRNAVNAALQSAWLAHQPQT
jgi:DNA-binding SARP family transcriptional activator